MADQRIACVDCHGEFIFSEGEQEFFKMKGFANPPKRCRACRKDKRAKFPASPQEIAEFASVWGLRKSST